MMRSEVQSAPLPLIPPDKPGLSKWRGSIESRTPLAAVPINPDADYPIAQVLAWAAMSVSTFYRLLKESKGPIIRKRGRRSFVRGSDFLTWRDTVQ